MNAIKFANKYILKNKKLLISYIILCIVISILGIILPIVSAQILDSIIATKPLNFIINLCCILFFIGTSNLIFSYLQNLIYLKLNAYSINDLTIDIISHIHKSSFLHISNMNSSYLNHRINIDSNELINFSLSLYSNFLQSILTLIASSTILIFINIKIFFISIFLILFSLLIYNLLKKKLFQLNKNLKDSQNSFFSDLNDQLYFTKFIKTNALSSWFIQKLNFSFQRYFKVRLTYEKLSNIFNNINGFIMLIAQLILFIFGASDVLNGVISLGIFTIIITYFNSLKDSISYFFSLGKSYQNTIVSFNRINELLIIPCDNNDGVCISHINKISISNLHFNYNKNQVLKDFSFKFSPGLIYGIWGENGSGKSTFINILLGIYSDFQGELLINDIPISSTNISYLREYCFSFCEQEPMLINDTIYNNISLNTSIEKSKINELIELIDLKNLINNNTNPLDSIINPYNSNLSGGEKQKISIIRTLLKTNSSVLIFDEPTSALDYTSKVNFIHYLKKLKSNKIIILISHDEDIREIIDESIYF